MDTRDATVGHGAGDKWGFGAWDGGRFEALRERVDPGAGRDAPPDDEPPFPDDPRVLPAGSVVDGALARAPVEDAADFVVIGSGAAGATAAVVLAEAGYSVAIVEEGDWVRTREFTKELFPAMARLFRDAATATITGRAFLPLMQGRCVGGSTTVNSAIVWRAPEHVFGEWAARFGLPADALSMAALAPHYDAIERDLNVHAVEDDALGEANALFGLAAHKLGIEAHRIRRYDRNCAGSAECLSGCRRGRKLGMNITYVPRALAAGARIFTAARVERVEWRGGRAAAVYARMRGASASHGGGGHALVLRARRGVLVAASAVQTPNVLRRSGVRARELGRHFQCHPGVSMTGMFERPVKMDFGATQGFNSLAFEERDRIKLETVSLPPELASARMPGVGPELMHRMARYGYVANWAVVIRAESEGTVDAAPFVGGDRVRFTMGPRDMARARAGLKVLAEMMFAVGAREVYPGIYGTPAVLTSPDQLRALDDASLDPRAYNMIASHLFGTARMGADARASVVGPDFAVHGGRGLYVVDSAVFPSNIGVNPQHTIMAVARHAAERIARDPLSPA